MFAGSSGAAVTIASKAVLADSAFSISEVKLDGSVWRDIEGNLRPSLYQVDEGFSPNVSHRELIKHIWVAAREACYYQIVGPQVREYLGCNHARLRDVVGANRRFVSTFLQHGGHDVLEQFV